MKKTLSIITILSSFIASHAQAKTEGNYFGIDLLRSNAKVQSSSSRAADNAGGLQPYYNHNNKDSAIGAGINYKYAFNFDNFFIAPGVSYDFLGNNVKSGYSTSNNDPFSQEVKLKSAFTLRTNFGYDINDQFAFYVPVGVSSFSYDISTSDVAGESFVKSKKTGNESAAFIGFGLSCEPVKNWVVNLEYNKYQNLKLTSATATLGGGQINAKTNVDAMRLGVAYKF